QLIDYITQQKEPLNVIKKKVVGKGGLTAYCGTNDLSQVHEKVKNGDQYTTLIFKAMAYQISKEIASHGATLCGSVDRIILTGGMAYNDDLVKLIKERVSYLAPIVVVAGERELQSLANNVVSVLQGELQVRNYN
ncbi:MAG: butyrate kinase, partial [Chitinivibrionales bacterium]|nr:butyrate kinase [Chitinivibrionales bacterium]